MKLNQTLRFPVNFSNQLPDGLHTYYKLDGNADEETDNGYDGSLTGTGNDPTNAPDRFNRPNRAYYFDGNDRLKLDHRALDDLSSFSISMWAKIETFEKMPCFYQPQNQTLCITNVSFFILQVLVIKYIFKNMHPTKRWTWKVLSVYLIGET